MGISTFPAPAAGKTRYTVELFSGTSWTVPAGVTYVNAKLYGGGGGGGSRTNLMRGSEGSPGQVRSTTFTTTPGASITYAIGAGGGVTTPGAGSVGGDTTMTGATTAVGGAGGPNGNGAVGTPGSGADNAGRSGSDIAAGTGGQGKIELEYWV